MDRSEEIKLVITPNDLIAEKLLEPAGEISDKQRQAVAVWLSGLEDAVLQEMEGCRYCEVAEELRKSGIPLPLAQFRSFDEVKLRRGVRCLTLKRGEELAITNPGHPAAQAAAPCKSFGSVQIVYSKTD